ncbi:MarR family winged helix-turn-helix transcriptional regulator [Anaerosphaera multitolerans]|uniref:HTH-type transcriptional regulator SarZ n=1 Tax=Anaerosphaera multitolerans TaxID=2487351 RepID=A0A437S9N1_9FIRM|nr:MarR family winged helix-turn-helix transcriptional regulator [Anaerosphaera multitolerans]RVU55853.1 MarR family transcriptional regulator [Anaerosphaera multitolerans]
MRKFSNFNTSEESFGFVFWQVYTLWSRRIKKELKKYKLTHTQFVILSVIAYLEKSSKFISQSDVSNLSKIDVMTVSTSIKTLVKNGYVIISSSSEDARANALKLSNEGKIVQNNAMKTIENVDTDFFRNANIETNKFLEIMHEILEVNSEDKQ